MRKGADCLSNWVSEAERQLRYFLRRLELLKDSTLDHLRRNRARSLKQLEDRIQASIVVVIDATNRTDAVCPALRRPGRLDRGFYFGQLMVDAREKILSIVIRKWASCYLLLRGSSTML